MATLMHDKLIHENVKVLAMFSRIFGYEFLMNNCDKMETAFYIDKNNFTCVMYKHEPNKNIIIGFSEKDTNTVFIGHYDDDGTPITSVNSIPGNHFTWISFNEEDNVRAVLSQKLRTLFDVSIDL